MKPVTILTGGTSGLGRYIARGLIQAGHHVVLIARDAAKTQALQTWLNTELEVEPADLSSLADTTRAAATIAARHPAIATLILNAGTFQTRRHTTSEGHELVLAVNHLSPFVLTRALQAPLAAGTARVVAVGSSASDRATIDPDNLELTQGWNFLRAYAQSKLALLTTSLEWSRRLAPTVSVNVVHPGFVATDLIRTSGAIALAWRALALIALTPEQGAATPLRAALDPALAGHTGRYLKPSGEAAPNRHATDPALAARVWQATERLTAHA